MQHTGQVYLSKQPPVAGVVASGDFQLQMLAMSLAKKPACTSSQLADMASP